MRDPESTRIGGCLYEVTPLPAGRGARLLARIAKIVGPALGKLLSSPGGLAKLLDMEVGSAIIEFSERLDPDVLDGIYRELADTTKLEIDAGSKKMPQLKEVFDLHFSGNYGEMFEWLAFALKVNYGPLVGLVRKLVPVEAPKKAA